MRVLAGLAFAIPLWYIFTMNNKNICIRLTMILALLSGVFASGHSDSPPASAPPGVRIAALAGPSGIPLAWLFENPPDLDGASAIFSVAAGPDLLLPGLLRGDVDIGVLPVNVAAKAYVAGKGAILMAAVMGEGMLSLVTADPAVSSLSDLKGKVVHVAGQGATPEYLFRYLLNSAGIPVDVRHQDAVQLNFSVPTAELAPALLAGKIAYAVLPEPFATVVTANPRFRRGIDLQAAFAAAQQKSSAVFPMTALVVRAAFATEHPQQLRLFLAALEKAIGDTNTFTDEAGTLAAKHALGIPASLAAQAIPRSAYVFRSAPEAREETEALLKIFAQVGQNDTLPDDGFYFHFFSQGAVD
jgi:NitT/TauT family transport system substrate-binding protein